MPQQLLTSPQHEFQGRVSYDPRWSWIWRGLSLAMVVPPCRGSYADFARFRSGILAGGAAPLRLTPAGLGFDFTGSTTGGFADVSHTADLLCAGSWTIAALVYSDGEASGQGILVKGNNSETAGQNTNYSLYYNLNTTNDDQAGNGFIVFFEQASPTGTNVSAKWVTPNNAGVYLLMATLDTKAQEIRMYNHGVKVRTRTGVSATAEASTTGLVIGRGAADADSGNRWNGTIPGVWIWKDRAFTDSEALLFGSDPFGMFRRPLPAFNAVAAPAGGARSFCVGMLG